MSWNLFGRILIGKFDEQAIKIEIFTIEKFGIKLK
jgi:hypothetical protein